MRPTRNASRTIQIANSKRKTEIAENKREMMPKSNKSLQKLRNRNMCPETIQIALWWALVGSQIAQIAQHETFFRLLGSSVQSRKFHQTYDIYHRRATWRAPRTHGSGPWITKSGRPQIADQIAVESQPNRIRGNLGS